MFVGWGRKAERMARIGIYPALICGASAAVGFLCQARLALRRWFFLVAIWMRAEGSEEAMGFN